MPLGDQKVGTCARCLKQFIMRSGAHKYCHLCGEVARREVQKRRQRRRRARRKAEKAAGVVHKKQTVIRRLVVVKDPEDLFPKGAIIWMGEHNQMLEMGHYLPGTILKAEDHEMLWVVVGAVGLQQRTRVYEPVEVSSAGDD